MDINALFFKKGPIEEAPFIHGCEEHACTRDRRKAVASAVLVRALVFALNGAVLQLARDGDSEPAITLKVGSASSAGKSSFVRITLDEILLPFGAVTYHIGLLVLAYRLHADYASRTHSTLADSYYKLLLAFKNNGGSIAEVIKPELLECADELYRCTAVQFSTAKVEKADRLHISGLAPDRLDQLIHRALQAPQAFEELYNITSSTPPPEALPVQAPEPEAEQACPAAVQPARARGFIGWQKLALEAALKEGDNVLLTGPTGTGKTSAVMELISEKAGQQMVVIKGMEGMTDLDFLGAYIPRDGKHIWADGPLLRAMRWAAFTGVILFVDELTRIPRQYLNLLIGLMNPVDRAALDRLGFSQKTAPDEDGPFYMVEVPMSGEVVLCPCSAMRIIAAGNFGRQYAVYDLDPALRRRFETAIEFEYLSAKEAVELLRETLGVSAAVAQVIARMSDKTRDLFNRGELSGCIDTGSMLNWASKCRRQSLNTTAAVMEAAWQTWADLVCGRDSLGQINREVFEGLHDYVESTNLLPRGDRRKGRF